MDDKELFIKLASKLIRGFFKWLGIGIAIAAGFKMCGFE